MHIKFFLVLVFRRTKQSPTTPRVWTTHADTGTGTPPAQSNRRDIIFTANAGCTSAPSVSIQSPPRSRGPRRRRMRRVHGAPLPSPSRSSFLSPCAPGPPPGPVPPGESICRARYWRATCRRREWRARRVLYIFFLSISQGDGRGVGGGGWPGSGGGTWGERPPARSPAAGVVAGGGGL